MVGRQGKPSSCGLETDDPLNAMQNNRKNENSRSKKEKISTKDEQQKVLSLLSSADWDRLSPRDIGELFDRLPFSRRLWLIMQVHGKQRQDLILLVSQPKPLVHAVPEEELLLTIKEIGEEDALPVISMTSDSQLRYLLDVDLWVQGGLEPSRALKWLSLILECGEDKVVQWFGSQDKEMVASVFHVFIHVAKPEEESEPPDPSYPPPHTLDAIYYIYFREPDVIPVIGRFIEIIRRRDENYYLWLMEELIWGLPAEREEMALRWRQARLDEKGFPSLDEALGLYQYIPEREIKRIISFGAKQDQGRTGKSPLMPGWYLKSLRQGESLLSLVLARMEDPDQIDRLHREFIHLCNMCMIADGREPGELENIRRSTEKVLHFINVGLEIISEGGLQKAVDTVTGLHLLFVFQIGYTQALNLRLAALELLHSSGASIPEEGATILGDQLEGMLRGVCLKRPLFYEGRAGTEREVYREFNTSTELGAAREALDTIRELDRLTRDVLGWPGGVLGQPPPDVAQLVKIKGLSAQKVILTAIARLVLEGRFRFAPLSRKEASHFLHTITAMGEHTDKPGRLQEEMGSSFAAWLREHWEGATDQRIRVIERFVDQSLRMLFEEAAYVNLDEPLDPQTIGSLVIENN